MSKRMSLPMTFEMSKDNILNDDTLLFARIKVCHSGLNLNNSTFSTEALEKAKDSIKSRPVLAYIRKVDGDDKKDFAGHEIEMTFKDGEIKFTYLERPIGVVLENNNYTTEVDSEGKTWVYVDAVIWKDYANEAIDIFEENNTKSVSMEIVVDDYQELNGAIDITSFRYTGITVLGDDVMPAMKSANIQVSFSENEDTITELITSRIKDINERVAFALEDKKETCEEKSDEEKVDEQAKEFETEEKQVFELSYRDKMDMAEKVIQEAYQSSNSWAYIIDMTDSNVIFRVYGETENCYKASYSLATDSLTIDLENKVEVFAKFLTQEEIDSLDAQIVAYAKEIRELTESFDAQVFELEETRTLLNNYQAKEAQEFEAIRKSEIDEVIADFDKDLSANDEFAVIKQNAYSYVNSEALEKELLLIYAKLNRRGNSTKKKSKNFSLTGIKINEEEQETKTLIDGSKYGEAAKYLVKSKED